MTETPTTPQQQQPSIVTDEWIEEVRINYGLHLTEPLEAARLWETLRAPPGAIAALGIALDELVKLRKQLHPPTS